jgi:hypothetical protein
VGEHDPPVRVERNVAASRELAQAGRDVLAVGSEKRAQGLDLGRTARRGERGVDGESQVLEVHRHGSLLRQRGRRRLVPAGRPYALIVAHPTNDPVADAPPWARHGKITRTGTSSHITTGAAQRSHEERP